MSNKLKKYTFCLIIAMVMGIILSNFIDESYMTCASFCMLGMLLSNSLED